MSRTFVIGSMHHLANIIGFDIKLLTFLEKKRSVLYRQFKIPKGNGKMREITTYLHKAPAEVVSRYDNQLVKYSMLLKEVHGKLNDNVFKQIELPACVYGIVERKSMKNAIEEMKGYRTIVRIDIKDFFPSTTSDLLLTVLKDKYGFEELASWLIARLCAYKGRLPQGASTSPFAASIAFSFADEKIVNYCTKRDIKYIRYYDDLIFGLNTDDKTVISELISFVESTINEYGYKINKDKLRIQSGRSKQLLGVVLVGKKVTIGRAKRRLLEAAIHNFIVKKQIPVGVDPVKYKRSLLAKAAYAIYISDGKNSRLGKLYEQLKSFDPNKHQFKSVYFKVSTTATI